MPQQPKILKQIPPQANTQAQQKGFSLQKLKEYESRLLMNATSQSSYNFQGKLSHTSNNNAQNANYNVLDSSNIAK